jgi:hypothetical protein
MRVVRTYIPFIPPFSLGVQYMDMEKYEMPILIHVIDQLHSELHHRWSL